MKAHRFFIFTAIGIVAVVLAVVLYAEETDFFSSLDLKLVVIDLQRDGNVYICSGCGKEVASKHSSWTQSECKGQVSLGTR